MSPIINGHVAPIQDKSSGSTIFRWLTNTFAATRCTVYTTFMEWLRIGSDNEEMPPRRGHFRRPVRPSYFKSQWEMVQTQFLDCWKRTTSRGR